MSGPVLAQRLEGLSVAIIDDTGNLLSGRETRDSQRRGGEDQRKLHRCDWVRVPAPRLELMEIDGMLG